MRTGVIGLGSMGRGMARSLARAGLLGGVWNCSPAPAEALAAELGVPVAADPAALAAGCEGLLTCVSADADVLEVIAALRPGLRPGQVVVDASTIGVDTVARIAAELAEVDVAFLDAPVSGGPEGAEAGSLTVMVGGDAAALATARPALEAIGTHVAHIGPSGHGQRAKAVNQVLAAGVVQAVSEALAFADASGLDTEALLPALASGAVGSPLLARRGARMLAGDFEPGFRLALHHKDLQLCRQLLGALDVSLPLVEMTLKHYDRLIAQGHGDDDITVLYRLKREMFEGGNRRSL